MIGHAELDRGLYRLHEYVYIPEEKSVTNKIVLNYKKIDIDIWHFRLGRRITVVFLIISCTEFIELQAT